SASGEMHTANVIGPRGSPVSTEFGLVPLKRLPIAARKRLDLPDELHDDAQIAIVEMAAASGLALLTQDQRNPWLTSSSGTGELLQKAAALGANVILLGIGGSATNDLGLGALNALGLLFHSAHGEAVFPPVPESWPTITEIRGKIMPGFPPIRIACDVTNPLLGPNGCAAIYGPQKGLKASDLLAMEERSRRIAQLLCAHCGKPESLMEIPGAGAAGGIAFGLLAATDAQVLSGSTLMSDWLDLPARIHSADVVLTGEGRFDESSAQGKGPGAILGLAAAAGRPAHVFAGRISSNLQTSAALHAITPEDWPLEKALRSTADLLSAAVRKQFR
ncbi:MAG TPA: glycerate kinase, partial [Opitutus sp.]|nr:glycerate kinase [Opitutus sp.]